MEDLARANYIFPDMITCLCLGVTGVDLLPIPGIGTNPVVEAVDCGCNILTFFQDLYKRGNRGGCYSRANLSTADEALLTILAGATLADCLSTPVGALLSGIIGGLLGIGGGTAGGPPGEAVGGIGGGISGAVVGDFVFDIVAEFTKNMIIQGSPFFSSIVLMVSFVMEVCWSNSAGIAVLPVARMPLCFHGQREQKITANQLNFAAQ